MDLNLFDPLRGCFLDDKLGCGEVDAFALVGDTVQSGGKISGNGFIRSLRKVEKELSIKFVDSCVTVGQDGAVG